jgi:hypothetical protein
MASGGIICTPIPYIMKTGTGIKRLLCGRGYTCRQEGNLISQHLFYFLNKESSKKFYLRKWYMRVDLIYLAKNTVLRLATDWATEGPEFESR